MFLPDNVGNADRADTRTSCTKSTQLGWLEWGGVNTGAALLRRMTSLCTDAIRGNVALPPAVQ